MNALDNRAARSHVNRMCLAANKPLLESGSAGYNGHVAVIPDPCIFNFYDKPISFVLFMQSLIFVFYNNIASQERS